MDWTGFEPRLRKLKLSPSEFEEQFSRASGPGGQNVNKVATRVEIVHLPSGLRTACQDARTQQQNRFLARKRLLDLIEKQRAAQRQEHAAERHRIKSQKRGRSYSGQRKTLENKRRRAAVKQSRQKPGSDN
jgi:protein subunit release factor B